MLIGGQTKMCHQKQTPLACGTIALCVSNDFSTQKQKEAEV